MTTPIADIVLIELRAGGKFHGQLDPVSMLLTVCESDRFYVYDLAASIREGRSVVADFGMRGAMLGARAAIRKVKKHE